jgi:hypothetical protein
VASGKSKDPAQDKLNAVIASLIHGRKPKITETQEHRAIADYLAKALAGHAIAFHIRNERASAWERVQAARQGILPGAPDIELIDGGRPIFFELKPRGWKARRAKGGNYTPHELRQLDTHKRLRLAGAVVEIIETLDDLKERLYHHCVPVREVEFRAQVERGIAMAEADPEGEFFKNL